MLTLAFKFLFSHSREILQVERVPIKKKDLSSLLETQPMPSGPPETQIKGILFWDCKQKERLSHFQRVFVVLVVALDSVSRCFRFWFLLY